MVCLLAEWRISQWRRNRGHPEPHKRRGTAPSSKFQAPSSKEAPSIKHQISGSCPWSFVVWSLSGAWMLELGAFDRAQLRNGPAVVITSTQIIILSAPIDVQTT